MTDDDKPNEVILIGGAARKPLRLAPIPDNPAVPVRKIQVLECTCSRCGETWVARGDVPVRCAKCGSPYWNRPYMRKGVKK